MEESTESGSESHRRLATVSTCIVLLGLQLDLSGRSPSHGVSEIEVNRYREKITLAGNERVEVCSGLSRHPVGLRDSTSTSHLFPSQGPMRQP